ISERFNAYAQQASDALNGAGIRAAVDDRNETIGKKIRENELKRIPYLLIVGEKEEAAQQVSVRRQGEGDKGAMSIEEFTKFLTEEIAKELME
ncbi:MAG: threonine--tRNA ligase, partial [Prevotellaceae bacterium]|nr:threonine--tRNA ligase [Prevotellaceae bacterium]